MTMATKLKPECGTNRLKQIYKKRSALPDGLGQAIYVVRDLGVPNCSVRVPMKLLNDAHIIPEQGVRIEVVGSMVLLRQGKPGVGQAPNPRSHTLELSGVKTQIPFDSTSYAAAVGLGYVLIGAEVDVMAQALAQKAPSIPYVRPAKVAELTPSAVSLKHTSDGLLGWQDIATHRTRKLYDALTAEVKHSHWMLAGFIEGESLAVARFADATVITPCTRENAFTQLKAASAGKTNLRMFIGPHIFDTAGKRTIRILVFDRKLVIVDSESRLGRHCRADQEMSLQGQMVHLKLFRAYIARVEAASLLKSARTPAGPANHAALPAPRASYNLRKDSRLQLQGAWLRGAGLQPGSRYSVEATEQGLLVCPNKRGDFAVTAYDDVPKLYVPRKVLESIEGNSVDVVCRPKGILLVPRAGAATSYGSRGRAKVTSHALH